MIKNEYNNQNEGLKYMGHAFLADLTNYISIGVGFGSVIWWGRGIDARLKAVEAWKKDIEERQTRIEDKIDNLSTQTTSRIDDCKNTLYNAIMSIKQ